MSVVSLKLKTLHLTSEQAVPPTSHSWLQELGFLHVQVLGFQLAIQMQKSLCHYWQLYTHSSYAFLQR